MEAFVIMVVAAWFWVYVKSNKPAKSRGIQPGIPLEEKYLKELRAHFKYYNQLDRNNQLRFEHRVQAFIGSNEFIPRGYTHISDEMKTLIAASAIQLTFGFRHLNFEHFNKILVYPGDYYSRITRRYHKGEVNPNGLIVLSWRNFVDGYLKENDGINLGLHEMAHALRLENAIVNGEFDFIDEPSVRRFDQLAYLEINRMKGGASWFFRRYGAINIHEFFAVAVENFFERPYEFYRHNPQLYESLAALLKQDTMKLFKPL